MESILQPAINTFAAQPSCVVAAGIYVLISKAAGVALLGWSSLGLSLYFLGSIQLLFLGIIGEYVFRIYRENQNRPLYFVQHYYHD